MRGIAYAGAMSRPSVRRSTAAISQSTSRARGRDPGRRLSPAPVATHRPAAPSVRGEELPAVSVPLPLARSNAGCSFARRSRLVSARGKPSRDIPATGTIRSSKNPAFCPASAFSWLASASLSCGSRAMLQAFAISSQCSPMLLPVARFLTSRICRRISRALRSLNDARRWAIERAWEKRRSRSERFFERRHHARRAGEHGRKRRNGPVQARVDLNFARDIRVAEVGNHRAPDEEIGPDSFAHAPPRAREGSCGYGLEPGHRAHHRHRELDGAEPGERPVHPRKRCAQARGELDVVAVHSGLIMYRIAMPGQACRGNFPPDKGGLYCQITEVKKWTVATG